MILIKWFYAGIFDRDYKKLYDFFNLIKTKIIDVNPIIKSVHLSLSCVIRVPLNIFLRKLAQILFFFNSKRNSLICFACVPLTNFLPQITQISTNFIFIDSTKISLNQFHPSAIAKNYFFKTSFRKSCKCSNDLFAATGL